MQIQSNFLGDSNCNTAYTCLEKIVGFVESDINLSMDEIAEYENGLTRTTGDSSVQIWELVINIVILYTTIEYCRKRGNVKSNKFL